MYSSHARIDPSCEMTGLGIIAAYLQYVGNRTNYFSESIDNFLEVGSRGTSLGLFRKYRPLQSELPPSVTKISSVDHMWSFAMLHISSCCG